MRWLLVAKVAAAGLAVALVATGIVYIHEQAVNVGKPDTQPVPAAKTTSRSARLQALKAKRDKLAQGRSSLPPASAGGNGTTSPSPANTSAVSANGAGSFAALEEQVSGEIGVAVAPFGDSTPQQIGGLEIGHAWSSFKVPIVVTLLKRGGLGAAEQDDARAAITASDNDAAAALFSQLGTTSTASAAVESVLSESGYPTKVATAPPPPGAVSTWGQTEWSLTNSAGFYRALACGLLLSPQSTDYVIGLMEEVIPEQQWGLGEAGISGQVAFKAGWGPDGSTGGPYLVRQSGILRSGSTGAVVTIAAQDDSGSFDEGVQDLDAVAGWVKEHVKLTSGSC